MRFSLLDDYSKWKEANSQSFSLFDDLHGILSEEESVKKEVFIDALFASLKLLFPVFIEYEGLILLKENWSKENFENLICQNLKGEELEYWMNLICIRGNGNPSHL